MQPESSPSPPGRRRWLGGLPAAGVLCGLLAVSGLLAGCDSSPSSKPTAPGGRSRTTTVPAADPQLCRDLLDRVVDMLRPERLGITAERKTAAGQLNSWVEQCGTDSADAPELPPVHKTLLPDDVVTRIADASFSSRDCDHIRTAMLFREMADDVSQGAANDVESVASLFHHVVRTIELVRRPPDDQPLTAYEIVLFGKGTAEDRAWVFVEIVRQMRLDSAIIRPPTSDRTPAAGEQTPAAFLVGVLIDGEVYLFDTRLGTPVPAGNDDGQSLFVQRPATLAEASSNPDVLARLNVGGGAEGAGGAAYPIRAADLESPQVEVVGDSSVWSPRMKRLQAGLAGEVPAVLYDPLADEEGDAGVLSRVAEAGQGRWDGDSIGVWAYPESRIVAFEQLEDQRPQDIQPWLRAPFPIISLDQTGQPQYGSPNNELLKTRIEHLQGELAQVTMKYTALRGLERALVTGIDPQTKKLLSIPEEIRRGVQQRVPPQYRQVHRRAAEDAHYWLGLAQYQSGQYAGAVSTLTSYLNVNGSGSWAAAAHELRAICLAEDGQLAGAVERLRALLEQNPRHPGRDGLEWLIRRWEGIAGRGESAATPPQNP